MQGVMRYLLILLLLIVPSTAVLASNYYRAPPYGNFDEWENEGWYGYKEMYEDVQPSTGVQRLYSYLYNYKNIGSYALAGGSFNDNPVPGNSPVYQPGPGPTPYIRGSVSGEAIGVLKIYSKGELAWAEVLVYCTVWGSYDSTTWYKNGEKVWKRSIELPGEEQIQDYIIVRTYATSYWYRYYTVTEKAITHVYGIADWSNAPSILPASVEADFYNLRNGQQYQIWISTIGLEVIE